MNQNTKDNIMLYGALSLSYYLVTRSRFLTLFVHGTLGHHFLGTMPFFKLNSWSYFLKSPTMKFSISYLCLPRTNEVILNQILSHKHEASFSWVPETRKFLTKNIPTEIACAWVALAGSLSECIIYPFCIGKLANEISYPKSNMSSIKEGILYGVMFGLILRWKDVMRYMSSNIQLGDTQSICRYMYKYAKVGHQATSSSVMLTLTLTSIASLIFGLKINNLLTNTGSHNPHKLTI